VQKKKKKNNNKIQTNKNVGETFDGSVVETRIMIRKITIRHADKHNRPRGQTIYQINQRLSVAL
jgi:hypothetical protein